MPANPTNDPTSEPLCTLLARLDALQPEMDVIDQELDEDNAETWELMSVGWDCGDRCAKLCVLYERGVITSDTCRELLPAVEWRDREDGVESRLPPHVPFVPRSEWTGDFMSKGIIRRNPNAPEALGRGPGGVEKP